MIRRWFPPLVLLATLMVAGCGSGDPVADEADTVVAGVEPGADAVTTDADAGALLARSDYDVVDGSARVALVAELDGHRFEAVSYDGEAGWSCRVLVIDGDPEPVAACNSEPDDPTAVFGPHGGGGFDEEWSSWLGQVGVQVAKVDFTTPDGDQITLVPVDRSVLALWSGSRSTGWSAIAYDGAGNTLGTNNG